MLSMYQTYREIDFSWFDWREEDLKNIWRYSNYSDYYYRSNNFQHTMRVFYMIIFFKEEIEKIFEWIDFKRLQIMALVHDDVERIIWDFQAWNKLNMTSDQLSRKDNIELMAIYELCKKSSETIEWYNYKDLLLEVFYKNTPMAQIVKFFDHYDAFWEAINEVFAWNISATKNAQNEYWKIILPFDYYTNRIKDHHKYYPLIDKLFTINSPLFNSRFQRIDFENIVYDYNEHTHESIQTDTWYIPYEFWKSIILSNPEVKKEFSLLVKSEWRFYDKNTKIFSKNK